MIHIFSQFTISHYWAAHLLSVREECRDSFHPHTPFPFTRLVVATTDGDIATATATTPQIKTVTAAAAAAAGGGTSPFIQDNPRV